MITDDYPIEEWSSVRFRVTDVEVFSSASRDGHGKYQARKEDPNDEATLCECLVAEGSPL